MIFYALITARAGSKGIKHKNLKKIKNKNLVEIAINEVKKSKKISKIFCSSNSKRILKISKKKNISTIKRPENLSGDKTTSYNVVLHFLKYLKIENIKIPDVIFLIQPTSPFMDHKIINEIIQTYKKKPLANTINSFVKIHHKYLYVNHTKINNKGKVKYLFYNERKKNTLRQNKQEYYAHGNVFSFKTNAIIKKKTLMPKPVYSVILKKSYQAIDIDDQEDLDISRILYNYKF